MIVVGYRGIHIEQPIVRILVVGTLRSQKGDEVVSPIIDALVADEYPDDIDDKHTNKEE
jgi:hypothetical protein